MSIITIEEHVKSEVEKAESKLKAWFAKTFQGIKAASPAASHKAIDNVIVNNPPPESHVPAPLLYSVPFGESEPTFNGAPATEAKSQSVSDAVAQQEAAHKAAQEAAQKTTQGGTSPA